MSIIGRLSTAEAVRDEYYGVGGNGGAEEVEEEEEPGWKIKLRSRKAFTGRRAITSRFMDMDHFTSLLSWWWWCGRSLSRPLIGGKTKVEQKLR